MMNDWYQRMVDNLQLNGKGERTQQAYTRSVRMLIKTFHNYAYLSTSTHAASDSTKDSISKSPLSIVSA
jgi:hypothetical protein